MPFAGPCWFTSYDSLSRWLFSTFLVANNNRKILSIFGYECVLFTLGFTVWYVIQTIENIS